MSSPAERQKHPTGGFEKKTNGCRPGGRPDCRGSATEKDWRLGSNGSGPLATRRMFALLRPGNADHRIPTLSVQGRGMSSHGFGETRGGAWLRREPGFRLTQPGLRAALLRALDPGPAAVGQHDL
jgi:hypothetical protein